MKKTVRCKVDLDKLPALTPEQRSGIDELEALSDESIDCGDIPQLDDGFWKRAVRNPFYKPTKTSTTVRVDSDVLAWLKSQGKGYQTRINAILREAMLRSFH